MDPTSFHLKEGVVQAEAGTACPLRPRKPEKLPMAKKYGCRSVPLVTIVLWLSAILEGIAAMTADPRFPPGYESRFPPRKALEGAKKLSSSFYVRTCPNFERIVSKAVASAAAKDLNILPELLRLPSHDAVVQGMDASLLLDPTPRNPMPEKKAIPNLTMGGFQIIDAIKKSMETACRGVVSCSDIVAAASREALFQSGGPYMKVKFGRRDSRTSLASYALAMLPNPSSTVPQLQKSFSMAGLLNKSDILLIASHSIGRVHCFSVMDTLYPTLSPYFEEDFGEGLRTFCPNVPANHNLSNLRVPTIFLDELSTYLFDNGYFVKLFNREAVLKVDHELLKDKDIRALAKTFSLNQKAFFSFYAEVYNRMLNLFVLTGKEGEIRKNCRKIN